MPNAAHRRRVQALATGAIAMVAAATQAMPAQADDTQNSSHSNKMLNNAHPAWATADKDRGAVPASQLITTRVFLTGQDPDGLAAAARAVTDPDSASYQQYLSADQIKQRFGATPAQIAAVQDWLKNAGLSISAVSGDWIDAQGDAAAVQKAFGTQIKNYQRPDGSVGYAASSAAVVPSSVANLVSGVSGLSQATTKAHTDSAKVGGTAAKGATTNGNPSPGCGVNTASYWGQYNATGWPAGSNGSTIPVLPCPYTPQQLRQAYGLKHTGKNAAIAVVDWYASPTMYSDAQTWSSEHKIQQFRDGQYTEWTNKGAWNHTSGPDACDSASGEESLDVEMAHGLAPDANIVYVGANSCTDQDLMAAEQLIVDNHLADVVSNSWGEIIHGTDGDLDPVVMAGYDRIFQKGALEGISFTFSSGDCGDDDPANRAGGAVNCNGNSARKQTEWPVSSQWVTAVGGTTLATDSSGGYAWEVDMGDHRAKAQAGAASWSPSVGNIPFYFGGGGGTSEDIVQPWYQAGKVPGALAANTHTATPATRPMRVLPDVAMNGSLATSVDVAFDDGTGYDHYGMGGTSVAAPEFAAVLADVKEASGGRAVGFANPSLYALNGGAFHDVTSRAGVTEGMWSNGSAGTLYQVGQDTSLTATPGYDNATGLGSPAAGFEAALAAQPAPAAPPQGGPAVSRVAGGDRYATAIAVSQKSYPKAGSAPAVVLATGGNFPDALAGVPLAKKFGAPLLLTPGNAADPRVLAEIHRVLAPGGKVYVLGGNAAVSPAVVNALKVPNQRIAGDSRFTTSVAIADALGDPSNVVLATGNGFADALAAGPYASDVFTTDGPAAILLTNDTVVPQAVYNYLHDHGGTVTAVGGQAVTAAHRVWAGPLTPLAGRDRFATAASVAAKFPYPQNAGVATGMQFADALTGAAMLAHENSPLLLTMPTSLPDATRTALQGLAHSLAGGGSVDIFGGPVAVSGAVENAVAGAVGGHVVAP